MEQNSEETGVLQLTEEEVKEWQSIELTPKNIPSLIGGIRSPDPRKQKLSSIIIKRLLSDSASTIIDFFLKGRYASSLIPCLHQLEYATFLSYTYFIFLTIIEQTFLKFQLTFHEVKGVVLLLRAKQQSKQKTMRTRTIDLLYQMAGITYYRQKLIDNEAIHELIVVGYESKENYGHFYKICEGLIGLCQHQPTKENRRDVTHFFFVTLCNWKKGLPMIPQILFYLGNACEVHKQLVDIICKENQAIKNMIIFIEDRDQLVEPSLSLLTKIIKKNGKVLELLWKQHFFVKIQAQLRRQPSKAKKQLFSLLSYLSQKDETAIYLIRTPSNILQILFSIFQKGPKQQYVQITEIMVNFASIKKNSSLFFNMIVEKKFPERLIRIISESEGREDLLGFVRCLWRLGDAGERNRKKGSGNRIEAVLCVEGNRQIFQQMQCHTDCRIAELADRIIFFYFPQEEISSLKQTR